MASIYHAKDAKGNGKLAKAVSSIRNIPFLSFHAEDAEFYREVAEA